MLAEARIGLGKAFALVVVFTVLLCAGGYYWAGTEWLKTENRDVYQFKTDLLKDKLSQNGDDTQAQLDLAVSQYLQGKTADALKTFQFVLKQEPQNESALLYMGLIKADMKDYKKAIPLLEEVVGINPVFQPRLLYYNLGTAYFQTNDFIKAARYLKIASQVDPASAPASFYLGMTYFKLGQYQEAILPLEKAAKLGENTTEAKKTLQFIDSKIKKQSKKQD